MLAGSQSVGSHRQHVQRRIDHGDADVARRIGVSPRSLLPEMRPKRHARKKRMMVRGDSLALQTRSFRTHPSSVVRMGWESYWLWNQGEMGQGFTRGCWGRSRGGRRTGRKSRRRSRSQKRLSWPRQENRPDPDKLMNPHVPNDRQLRRVQKDQERRQKYEKRGKSGATTSGEKQLAWRGNGE